MKTIKQFLKVKKISRKQFVKVKKITLQTQTIHTLKDSAIIK